VSTDKSHFPKPGDEVAYVQYNRVKMPGIAWIHFTDGNCVEFPVWEEDRREIPGHPGILGTPIIDHDPTMPKKEQDLP
jgi:hypothetical protein